ncbi:tigger transposable element-derived protein 1-like [Stomoxys calcitrans]|uniref:tigger transposable element-derived protein 1-like n=1 Tax=Stomoxys calcitrans TaxID=35570 RepID=UPI0027E2DCBA|nr:tigger transposable element-derived protein 1-like [Stomoxys calcitrans]
MENCAVSELKAYCSFHNIEFKVLLLLDNAPSHPVYCDDYSENIKVVFMPPNTTSVIQPMDQGVISNFKSYYLRRNFSQLLKATDGDNMPSMKDFWKNYSIRMAVENIIQSWKEVKESCMNGAWRQLWPECIIKDMEEINDVPSICKELAETARNANFEGVEEEDISELLLYDKELDNESLISAEMNNTLDTHTLEVEPEIKKLTTAKISEAMQLITQAIEIFKNNDPIEDRSLKVSRNVTEAINCYKEIYLKIKALTIQ